MRMITVDIDTYGADFVTATVTLNSNGAITTSASRPTRFVITSDPTPSCWPGEPSAKLRKKAQRSHERTYYQRFNKQHVPRNMKT